MKGKKKRILFFIDGPLPSAADLKAARKIGAVSFRNAQLVSDDDSPEMCDGVAGAVPRPYARFPRVGAPVVGAQPPADDGDDDNADDTDDPGDAGAPVSDDPADGGPNPFAIRKPGT